MTGRAKILVPPAVVALALFAGETFAAEKITVRGGHMWGIPIVQKLTYEFRKANPKTNVAFDCKTWTDRKNLQRFRAGECQILVHYARENVRKDEDGNLKGPDGCSVYLVGQAKVIALVNWPNTTEALTVRQIRDLLRDKGKGVKRLGDKSPDGAAKCFGEKRWGLSRNIIRRSCMLLTKEFSQGFYCFRDDFAALGDPQEVVKKVRSDPNAMGFILLKSEAITKVKLLAIARDKRGPFVKPKLGPWIQEDYPLSEPLILYLHPKAPPLAKAFCEFAVGPEGAKIAAKHGLITPWHQKQAEAAERLKLMKAGKGVPIRGVGSMGGSAVMRDLAIEYVKAKEVVQMACRPATSELTAVGYFVNAKDRELLVLDGPISEKAKKLHGKKWDFLEPETHVLATGRGIAICVNSMNKLGTLTLEQVRHLFSKKTSTWRDVTGAEVKIKRYGLAGTDPAARVFYSRINPPAACARPDTRLGTQAVLAALSRDPHGIAFVDAAAANDLLGAAKGKSGIKVLSIGAKGKAAPPTAANVKAGKYPISQQLTLHLSPRASQTTRDFVTFILSGAADEVFTKHGLTPAPRATKSPATPVAGKKPAAKKPAPKKPRKRSPRKNR